jgi:anti-sigma regulatory factor (Ser/Thr protein kinase)
MAELGRTERSRRIRQFLIAAIRDGSAGFILEAVKRFGISRQSVHRHLAYLVANDYLVAEGPAGGRKYRLGPVRLFERTYDLRAIDESTVYQRDFAFLFEGLPKNIVDICHYGFTEMVNNAIDHSEGSEVYIGVARDREVIAISISDDGEGIFERIARILNLADPREALFELHKGKLTTDPDHHTGEGVFFASRMFDDYIIESGDLAFVNLETQTQGSREALFHDEDRHEGTTVMMLIHIDSERTQREVFDEFATAENYQFDKTIVPVRMALYEGEQLISRSQARRILSRVERFRIVILDFEGVYAVGRSFVDEAFRVFAREHPRIEFRVVNASDEIEAMIRAKQEEVGT